MHRLLALICVILLAACGGGSGPAAPPLGPGEQALDDPTDYSSQPDAALPGATEAAAVTRHSLVMAGRSIAYTATAGHLIARHPTTQAAQASVFYVAYTADGALPAARPVTFFYNGGPGSASVWLQLGSFGPKRLVTGVPQTSAARPFPLVDNADSLLDTTDLVFVNAVGSGRSQAIAPFRNRSFWGVDADAELFRDFIVRYLQVNGRGASPKFLFGESYGGPRTAVLARRLQDAGIALDGLVLQSPALDYNSNCSIAGPATLSCAGYLPTYAAVGAFHRLTDPVPTDLDAWVLQALAFTTQSYAPAVAAWLAAATPAPDLWLPLAGLTGLPAAQWESGFNPGPDRLRNALLPGQLLGRYDGRMAAPVGSALAAEGDPSSTWITSSFAAAIDSHLRDTLRYGNASTYVLLSNAIQYWDFRHDGRSLPDTVPDLAAALAQNASLRVLAINGLHDLATPFHVTETDLARLASDRVQVSNYAGGHMSYLDDGTRAAQKAALVAFYGSVLATVRPQRQPLQLPPAVVVVDHAGTPQARGPVRPAPEPALQAPLRDPWVPPLH
jgi:carboxypeptidase C (cathepsin A)